MTEVTSGIFNALTDGADIGRRISGRKEQTMTLTEFVNILAEELESEGVTYEDLVRIDEEVRAEVREEGADDED